MLAFEKLAHNRLAGRGQGRRVPPPGVSGSRKDAASSVAGAAPDGLGKTTVLFRASGGASALSAGDRQNLKAYARSLTETVASAGSFCCVITGDRELQRLNREFLGHDYPTDVLSFPSGARGGDLGEIAISLSRAEAQARDFGHSCFDELRILMLHGVLHLVGFDHETDHGEMARAERKWRASFGLPSSLIARSRRQGGAKKA